MLEASEKTILELRSSGDLAVAFGRAQGTLDLAIDLAKKQLSNELEHISSVPFRLAELHFELAMEFSDYGSAMLVSNKFLSFLNSQRSEFDHCPAKEAFFESHQAVLLSQLALAKARHLGAAIASDDMKSALEKARNWHEIEPELAVKTYINAAMFKDSEGESTAGIGELAWKIVRAHKFEIGKESIAASYYCGKEKFYNDDLFATTQVLQHITSADETLLESCSQTTQLLAVKAICLMTKSEIFQSKLERAEFCAQIGLEISRKYLTPASDEYWKATTLQLVILATMPDYYRIDSSVAIPDHVESYNAFKQVLNSVETDIAATGVNFKAKKIIRERLEVLEADYSDFTRNGEERSVTLYTACEKIRSFL